MISVRKIRLQAPGKWQLTRPQFLTMLWWRTTSMPCPWRPPWKHDGNYIRVPAGFLPHWGLEITEFAHEVTARLRQELDDNGYSDIMLDNHPRIHMLYEPDFKELKDAHSTKRLASKRS